jgi:hypothetical protein
MSQYFFKMSQAEKNSILDKHKTIYDGYVTEYGQQSNTQPLYVQDYANDKEGMVVSNKGVVKPYTNMGINESHSGSDMIGDGSDDLKNGTVDLEDLMGYPSPNEDEFDYVSLGMLDDSELEEGFDDFDIKRKRGGIDYNEKEFPGTNKYKVDIEDLNFGDFLEPKRDDSNELDFDYEEVDEEHGTFDHMSDEYGDDDLNYGSMKRNYHDIDNIMPIIPDFEDEVDEDVLPEFMEKLNESLDMFKRFKKYN